MDTKLINLNKRSQYITSINNFISSSKAEVDRFLNLLGWTQEFTLKKENVINCPFEDSHRIPEQRLGAHLESCPCRPPGKDRDDEARPKTSDVPEQQATQSSCPSGDLLLTEFHLPYNTNNDQSAPKTLQEVLQAERDLKRRRIRYRTCKVHTKSKSHTEVMRGVIGSQMQALEDWIIQEQGTIAGDDETSRTTQQDAAENKKEKREMIWLDWNFRGNPHTRWKDIVASEKRRNSATGEENGKTFRRYNSEESEVERNTDNSRRRYERDFSSASCGNYSKNSYEKHEKKYEDRCRKTDYGKYEYKNKRDRKHSYERSSSRRRDVTSKSRDGNFEIESDDSYSEKQKKYSNKRKDKHEKYDDVNSDHYNEKRKRNKDESANRHYEKHKKYRGESRDGHKNRRSRSNSEKPSLTDENIDYKRKKHSKKKKKHRKHSKSEKLVQTSDSDSKSD